MYFDLHQRIFFVKTYYEKRSIIAVQRAFKTKYDAREAPSRNAIMCAVNNFEKNGSVIAVDPRKGIKSKKRENAEKELVQVVAENPSISSRKAASALGVSQTLIVTILNDDLHLKPYKFHVWHKLEVHDYAPRVEFARWFLSLPINSENLIVCSDEAYFTLTLPVNKQNNRIWADSQPLVGIETPLHDEKVLVWCAISAARIYGPYFFSEHVNQHNYLTMLKDFFWKKHLDTADYKKYYFQQDGATPHTANTVQTWLTTKFGGKFVNKKMWPPRLVHQT
jgi:transposase